MDAQDSTPFTQWECEMVVYRADAQGAATDIIEWIGGCENRLEVEQGFAEERAERSGDPYSRMQFMEEVHTLQLENLWLSRYQLAGDGPTFDNPILGRDQRFVAVLLWQSEETGIWHKRTYFGVQINPLSITSENEYFTQRVPMRAGYFLPENGRLPEVPDLSPSGSGLVRYVSDSGSADLYRYSFTAGNFVELGNAAGRITFPGADGVHQFRILIDGVLALAVDNAGVLNTGDLDAEGGSFTSRLPRAEFYNGLTRYASLTKDGLLAAPNFIETAVNPGLSNDFELRTAGGSWLATIGPAAVQAPAIDDSL
jgi:hypothetical protein